MPRKPKRVSPERRDESAEPAETPPSLWAEAFDDRYGMTKAGKAFEKARSLVEAGELRPAVNGDSPFRRKRYPLAP